MADLVNPFANPYLPSFANQRPVISTQPPQQNLAAGVTFAQIHPVKGYEGADAYAAGLANGSSEILSEADPNTSRVYVVAKDTNGQVFVQGLRVIPEERPKPVTMDDLSSTMNQILERLNRLEGDRNNDQSNHGAAWKGAKQPGGGTGTAGGRNSAGGTESAGIARTNDAK